MGKMDYKALLETNVVDVKTSIEYCFYLEFYVFQENKDCIVYCPF